MNSVFEIVVIAIGLSMDAFAVAVCKGLGMRRINYRHGLIIALFFGIFQGIMPVIGWTLGSAFEQLITPVDHWVAFFLLVAIGAKMLWDSFHDEPKPNLADSSTLSISELFLLAIATSIDALAVGITFAILQVNIVMAALTIGLITFILSFLGVIVGNHFGARFEKPATIAGGVALTLIGLKILLEHLGIISFSAFP